MSFGTKVCLYQLQKQAFVFDVLFYFLFKSLIVKPMEQFYLSQVL